MTTRVLARLRSLMRDVSRFEGSPLLAYIVPSSDAHGSEYICERDKRRQFISDFSGSAGTGVVLHDTALLWTDGRYYIAAAQELDHNWTLMKDGLEDTPSISTWLCNNLPPESLVGIDARLYEETFYASLENDLKRSNIHLYHTKQNLIDLVWDEQPKLDVAPLMKIDLKYAGKSISQKLNEVREQMSAKNADAYVVTSLDDTAWLLNLRGSDIPFNTVFFSYCIITQTDLKLFIHLDRLTDDVKSYLLIEEPNMKFYNYEEFYSVLEAFYQDEIVGKSDESTVKKVLLCTRANHAIHAAIGQKHAVKDLSVINRLKIIKNKAEIESSRDTHIRDSLALCEFFHWLEETAKTPDAFQHLNEYKLGERVDETRGKVDGFMRPSFDTICGSGSNSAIIHYRAQRTVSKLIEMNNVLLLDSGGHYSNAGTTDVTRTVFVGDTGLITDHLKDCFTRVLKGHIQLALRIFPSNTNPVLLDAFARQALWEVGLNYGHGTGHGVGFLLNVHEMPLIGTRKSSNLSSTDIGLQEDMIVTIEPGYYEEGNFGIRIENCELVVQAHKSFKTNQKFLTFEPLTYVPIQRELIKTSILNNDEIRWLNHYHDKCRQILGERLKAENKIDLYNWVVDKTQHI